MSTLIGDHVCKASLKSLQNYRSSLCLKHFYLFVEIVLMRLFHPVVIWLRSKKVSIKFEKLTTEENIVELARLPVELHED